jgi:glycosyltransferase involved in cell wall biosynthesis
MNREKLKIALYSDRRDWILGTIANEIRRSLSAGSNLEFTLVSEEQIFSNPVRGIRRLRGCHVIHWIAPGGAQSLASLFPHQAHLVTIHHCLDGDQHWPANYKLIDRVLTVSGQSRAALQERGFADVQVVHNGVDPNVFRPLNITECRQRLKLPDAGFPLVGFFGKESSNPGDRKGTRCFLQAMGIVAQRKKVGVLLSGEGWDSLSRALTELSIPVFKRRVAHLSDMPPLYGAIDVYLCSSRIEGGPVTVIEAMSCARSVVATEVGIVPEAIRQGENGLIAKAGDSGQMARQIVTLLDEPSFSETIGRKARESVLQAWTWETVLQPLSHIYQSAFHSDGSPGFSPFPFARDFTDLLVRSLYRKWARFRRGLLPLRGEPEQ